MDIHMPARTTVVCQPASPAVIPRLAGPAASAAALSPTPPAGVQQPRRQRLLLPPLRVGGGPARRTARPGLSGASHPVAAGPGLAVGPARRLLRREQGRRR